MQILLEDYWLHNVNYINKKIVAPYMLYMGSCVVFLLIATWGNIDAGREEADDRFIGAGESDLRLWIQILAVFVLFQWCY